MVECNSEILYLVQYEMNEKDAIDSMQADIIKLQFDCMFIPSFLYWIQKHNIISNKDLRYRNKNSSGWGIMINGLVWDAIGYTSTTGFFEYIGDYSDEKETLVVLDFKILKQYNSDDLHGFYDRIQIYRNSVINKSGLTPINWTNPSEYSCFLRISI